MGTRVEARPGVAHQQIEDHEMQQLLCGRSELIDRYRNLRREIFGPTPLPPKNMDAATPAR